MRRPARMGNTTLHVQCCGILNHSLYKTGIYVANKDETAVIGCGILRKVLGEKGIFSSHEYVFVPFVYAGFFWGSGHPLHFFSSSLHKFIFLFFFPCLIFFFLGGGGAFPPPLPSLSYWSAGSQQQVIDTHVARAKILFWLHCTYTRHSMWKVYLGRVKQSSDTKSVLIAHPHIYTEKATAILKQNVLRQIRKTTKKSPLRCGPKNNMW